MANALRCKERPYRAPQYFSRPQPVGETSHNGAFLIEGLLIEIRRAITCAVSRSADGIKEASSTEGSDPESSPQIAAPTAATKRIHETKQV
jgi:hypothetical protein